MPQEDIIIPWWLVVPIVMCFLIGAAQAIVWAHDLFNHLISLGLQV